MAKKTSYALKQLVPEENPKTGTKYIVRKPTKGLKVAEKLRMKKYDPVLKKHVWFIEKKMQKANNAFFRMTGKKQKFKLDYRKDGKLDVTFVRMDRKSAKGGWNMQYPDYYLTKNGFNNPKKIDTISGNLNVLSMQIFYLIEPINQTDVLAINSDLN